MTAHTLRRHVPPALEWLDDVSGKCARVTAMGSTALLVENHCGVESFSCEEILLKTRCGPLAVAGGSLSLNEVRRDAVMIRGRIACVRFPCESDEG